MENVEFQQINLIGLALESKTTNEDGKSGIDCGYLWQRFELEKTIDKVPDKLSDEILAVYYDYEGDHTQPFSYFIGCKVKEGTEAPAGLDSLTIPQGKFLRMVAKGVMPECITNEWKQIWNSQLSRAYKYDFELYDHRSNDWSNAEVDIYVSVEE